MGVSNGMTCKEFHTIHNPVAANTANTANTQKRIV